MTVGVLEDVGDVICVDCRAQELETRTTLTELEAKVAAWKQLGDGTIDEIASRLDVDASMIEECERRIRDRVENAPGRAAKLREEVELFERTASELRGL